MVFASPIGPTHFDISDEHNTHISTAEAHAGDMRVTDTDQDAREESQGREPIDP